MGAALILVGLLQPIQEAPAAYAEPTVQISSVEESKTNEVKVPEVTAVAVEEPKPAPVAPVVEPVAPPKPVYVPSSGDCEAYMVNAGITDLVNARELIRRENASCDAQKYNMGGSNACGIAQELPCGKSGCGIPPNADGQCQIKWMKSYVERRYGSFAAAIQYHNANGWY